VLRRRIDIAADALGTPHPTMPQWTTAIRSFGIEAPRTRRTPPAAQRVVLRERSPRAAPRQGPHGLTPVRPRPLPPRHARAPDVFLPAPGRRRRRTLHEQRDRRRVRRRGTRPKSRAPQQTPNRREPRLQLRRPPTLLPATKHEDKRSIGAHERALRSGITVSARRRSCASKPSSRRHARKPCVSPRPRRSAGT